MELEISRNQDAGRQTAASSPASLLTIGIMNQVWKEQRVLGHGEMQTAKRQGNPGIMSQWR